MEVVVEIFLEFFVCTFITDSSFKKQVFQLFILFGFIVLTLFTIGYKIQNTLSSLLPINVGPLSFAKYLGFLYFI
jgi:hypothetical protein